MKEFVSPEYERQLHDLAELLCTPERFGSVAVASEVQLTLEIPENIEVGVE